MSQCSAVHRRVSPRVFTRVAFATVSLAVPLAALGLAAPGSACAQTPSYAPMQPQALPEGETAGIPHASDDAILPERLRRAEVNFDSSERAGTVIIDTANTVLYYMLGHGHAIRYGIGVGREGFTWSGVERISRKAQWPDWVPPAQMIARQPYLPRFMAGGPNNPLGARALYLGSSEYRIHGTNDPSTIGKFVSSGCIRMTNEDIIDLFGRTNVGTKVVVLPKNAPLIAKDADPSGRQAQNISASPPN